MSNRLTKPLQLILILLIPVVIVLTAARFLATDQFLAFEYGRAGFPPDSFGFTVRQRFVLASTNVHYVLAHLPDDELAKQTQDGVAVYNRREVTHMADVRAVFQSVMQIWWGVIILSILTGLILSWKGRRKELASAIRSGGALTVILIGSIALLALLAWQTWFENFHLLFFKPGSWLFSYSDTLIRLFPLQFWMDATFTISAISLIGGFLLAFIGWHWKRSQRSYT
ncbi:MAG: TIGR01906 family membrane protein [Anaerolineae bacterium]|nr:MAG: TIGR01906 family membrane protein [Anaerolineae bacterium]WKZ44767.1 MAG: TIGR01906 family membrane protein [Anaerolineales bacterium]